jgi:hypothetical protein
MLVVRDPKRAVELASRGIATARRMGLRTILSSLFINGMSAARRTGAWDWAIQQFATIDADQLEPRDRAAVLVPILMLKAARGTPIEAELAGAEAVLTTTPDTQAVSLVGLARAFLLVIASRYSEATDEYFAAARASGVFTQWALPLAGRSAVLAGDSKRARDAVQELDELGISGPALAADVETIRAGIAALEGHTADALAGYRRALTAWRDLGLDWDEALCGIEMTMLLDPAEAEVRAAGNAAREILVRLGAIPFVERLDVALARSSARAGASASRTGSATAAT